jgi:hypothetical protein
MMKPNRKMALEVNTQTIWGKSFLSDRSPLTIDDSG